MVEGAELLVAATYAWLCSGGLAKFVTGSNFVLEMTVLGPLVFALGIQLISVWKKNDYILLPSWNSPMLRLTKKERESLQKGDMEDGLGNAGIDSFAAGNDSSASAPSNLGGFALPPLSKGMDTSTGGQNGSGGGGLFGGLSGGAGLFGNGGVKMPALPMRSPFGGGDGGAGFGSPAAGSSSSSVSGTDAGQTGSAEDEGDGNADEKHHLLRDSFATTASPEYEEHHVSYILKMSGFQALIRGRLSATDYATVAIFFFFFIFIFLLGGTVTIFETQYAWVGPVLSGGILLLFCTYYCVKKYFNVLQWTWDMSLAAITGSAFLLAGGLVEFLVVLNGD